MHNIKIEKDVMGFCFQIRFRLYHLEVKEMWEDKKQTIKLWKLQEKAR